MRRKLILTSFLFSFLATFFVHKISAASDTGINIDTKSPTLKVGEKRTIDLNLQNVQNLGAYEFNLTYNPSVVHVDSISNASFLGSTNRTVVTLDPPNSDNSTGTASYGAFTFGTASGPDGNGTISQMSLTGVGPGNSDLFLNTISVTDIDGTLIPISISPASLTISSPTPTLTPTHTPTPTLIPSPTPTIQPTEIPTSTPSTTPINTPTVTSTPIISSTPTATQPPISPTLTPSVTPSLITPAPTSTLSPSPSPTTGPNATLKLVQESASVLGKDFHVSVQIDTNSGVTGVDAVVLYDPSHLTIKSATALNLLYYAPPVSINSTKGIIRISEISNIGESFTGSGQLADLVFTPKLVGPSQIGFDYQAGSTRESNVIESQTGKDILSAPAPLLITVLSKPQLRVKLVTPFQTAISNTVEITQSDTWKKTVVIPPDGVSPLIDLDEKWFDADVKFKLKLNGFLKKEFIVNVQPGINDVTVEGLLGGDLNDDGIINTIDLGEMYNNWFLDGIGDLNLDGIVNTADYWMLASNYLKEDQ